MLDPNGRDTISKVLRTFLVDLNSNYTTRING